jgi:hypothetical protein
LDRETNQTAGPAAQCNTQNITIVTTPTHLVIVLPHNVVRFELLPGVVVEREVAGQQVHHNLTHKVT